MSVYWSKSIRRSPGKEATILNASYWVRADLAWFDGTHLFAPLLLCRDEIFNGGRVGPKIGSVASILAGGGVQRPGLEGQSVHTLSDDVKARGKPCVSPKAIRCLIRPPAFVSGMAANAH